MIVDDENVRFYHRVSSRSFKAVVWTLGSLFFCSGFSLAVHARLVDPRAAPAGLVELAFISLPVLLSGALGLRLIYAMIFPPEVFVRVTRSTVEYRDASRTGWARGTAIPGTCEVGDVHRLGTETPDIILYGTSGQLLVIPKIVFGSCDEFLHALRELNPRIRGG